ncbi:Cytochrome c oxidase assembly protein COX11 mitochondrial [Dissostichus eleginoides]|uniref:Cytochrome c oxidase assembly protein COX11 mitochondrial n=1 Tax=Dissostichus eleginoides TaxID=100907 RepID=A0AAD9BGT7_DISEL|nr:Cytochrome c oxidase assembly protein COX11 mitochondrial [Dissostichus eleginoides]
MLFQLLRAPLCGAPSVLPRCVRSLRSAPCRTPAMRPPSQTRGLKTRRTRNQEEEWRSRNKTLLTYIAAAGVGMIGLSYASVPLYRLYCQATGLGGAATAGHDTDQVETMEPVKERILKITFNADTHSSMQWNFRPQQSEIYHFENGKKDFVRAKNALLSPLLSPVVPGETALAFYRAKNPTNKHIIGISTYNVRNQTERIPLFPERPSLFPLFPERPSLFPLFPERPSLFPLFPERPSLFPLFPERPSLFPLFPERPPLFPLFPERPSLFPERPSLFPLFPERPSLFPERPSLFPLFPERPPLFSLFPERPSLFPLFPERPSLFPLFPERPSLFPCFCFEEQRLNPHEEVDMPVFFYIDPEFDEDPRMARVDTITLSYTFFEAKEGQKIPLPGYSYS